MPRLFFRSAVLICPVFCLALLMPALEQPSFGQADAPVNRAPKPAANVRRAVRPAQNLEPLPPLDILLDALRLVRNSGRPSPRRTLSFLDSDPTPTGTFPLDPTPPIPVPLDPPPPAPTPTDPTAPPTDEMAGPPVNLTVHGKWNNGSQDILRWEAVEGARSYNVYKYDEKIATVTEPTCTVGTDKFFAGAIYTVTSIDKDCGCESIPSAPATAIGGFDPANTPGWAGPWVPGVPGKPTATIEWIAGKPRVLVEWKGVGNTAILYRDGQPIADGLSALYGYDTTIKPGDTHVYTVAAVNSLNVTRPVSAPSEGVSVQIPAVVPTLPDTLPAVEIVKTVPNDDSVLIVFKTVPGATDYRVYIKGSPSKVKYAGRAFAYPSQWYSIPAERSIEWNGGIGASGAEFIVEALDKPGPFQKMDGMMGPGGMTMDGMTNASTNGQGDPSNVPNVLARSAPVQVNLKASEFGKNGQQVFFDNFRNSQVFAANRTPDAEIVAASGGSTQFAEFENNKWVVRNYTGDTANSAVFVMGNHLMDTLYDGGGPNAPNIPSHNNNASMVFLPKATADLTGDKTLHATFEVDPHFDGRRWCTFWIFPAGDKLLIPGKSAVNGLANDLPTVSGNALLWDIHNENHDLNLLANGTHFNLMQQADFADGQSFERVGWDHVTPEANGTALDLDKRHRFDIYVSATRFRLEERDAAGRLIVARDKAMPADVLSALQRSGLLSGKVQVGFGHEVYHTANDRAEILNFAWDSYWCNYRPWSDERHWDNMGFEVLEAFPSL